jgi:hypothetical protein
MLTGGLVISKFVCRKRLAMIFRSRFLVLVGLLGSGRRILTGIRWISALRFLWRILLSRISRLVSIMGKGRPTKKGESGKT